MPVQYFIEWEAWMRSAENGERERRLTAVLRLRKCLRSNAKKLYLANLGLTELPANLPLSLTALRVFGNQLSHLPENLPPSLTVLQAYENRLTRLPEHLPAGLKELNVARNKLTNLPANLPPVLKILDVYKNKLTTLPANLPASLTELKVSFNRLSHLPENLPPVLRRLYAGHNLLTSLPANLPLTLDDLHVFENKLTHLPEHLPPALKRLHVSDNRLSHWPENLPTSLDLLAADYNQFTCLPKNFLDIELTRLYLSDNPLTDDAVEEIDSHSTLSLIAISGYPELPRSWGNSSPRSVSDSSDSSDFESEPEDSEWNSSDFESGSEEYSTSHLQFIKQIQFWTEELEPWHAIKAQEHPDVFGDFLQKLSIGENKASKELKPRVANWLNYLAKEENSELRKCTFLIAREATESCVDRASFYFNNMYTAMLEDALIKENAPLERIINTILSLFRMQVLEKIAAATSAKRRGINPDFSEDIEIYLAYQYKLRDKLSLPVYTELQFEITAGLTDNDLNAAIDSLFEQEKSHFLRYLVMQSGCWNAKLEQWDKEKKQAVEESYLQEIAADKLEERVDNVLIQQGIAKDDIDGRRLVSKQLADELLYQKRYQLSRQFLTAHHALKLIEGFDCPDNFV